MCVLYDTIKDSGAARWADGGGGYVNLHNCVALSRETETTEMMGSTVSVGM